MSSAARAADPAPADPPPASAPPASMKGELAIVPFALPAYQPETSFMIGGAAMFVYRYPQEARRRESQILTAVAASVKKQVTVLVQPDLYLWEDRIQIGGQFGAARFPDTFFGIGNNTSESDDERFTPVTFEAGVSPKLRLLEGMYLGPDVRFHYANITETEEGGMLRPGIIPGSSGGRIFQLGLSGFYDTRDSTIYPHRGHIVKVLARTARESLGSEFEFNMLSIDARKYFPLPWTNHVLAMQALVEIRDGAPPFYDLGLMGGMQTMRGYFQGRFRDRNYLAAQVEYRMPLFWRFGAVGFASAGEVAHTLSDLRFSDVKFAGGGGLRFAPLKDVPVNIRFDVAYGNALNFYFGVGEAF